MRVSLFVLVVLLGSLMGGCPKGDDVVAERKTITLTWPFAGIHRGRGYQQTAPYTCAQASNVRTVETLEGRRRGGRRPGLTAVYPEMVWTGITAARLITQVSTTSGRRLLAFTYAGDPQFEPRVWAENASGQMVAVTNLVTDFNAVANLQAAEYQGQVFVADYGGIGNRPSAGYRILVQVNNATLTPNTGYYYRHIDYQLLMLGAVPGRTVVLTEYNGSGIDGAYMIAATNPADTITLTGSTGKTGYAWAHIDRCPKIWDSGLGTLGPMAVGTWGEADGIDPGDPLYGTSKGQVPVGYRLVCRYSNRLFWAGSQDYPYAWICSRSGDPLDYDFRFGLDDVARATYWQAGDQKTIGQPIKALIPFGNDFLLFGCTNSLWLMQGDPTYGGSLGQVDPNVGVLSETAWCYLPGGSAMILSHDGLYIVSGRTVLPVSQGKLPKELVGIDPTLYTISMCYEPRHRGVHIIASKTAATTHELPIAYWYDLEQQAPWPVAFDYTAALDQSPLRAELQLLDNGSSRVLLATKHGEVAYFNDAAVKDLNDTTGTAVTGTVTLGPFRLGADDFSEGMLTKLVGILDAQSANVTWTVHVADTAEGAIAAAAHSTGTWTPGRSMPEYVRARGAAMCIKLSSTGKWAFEAAIAEVEKMGLVRAL